MRFLSSLGRHKLFLGSVFLFVLGFGLFGYGHSALAEDPVGAAAGYINTGLSYLILTLANILQILGGYIGKLALSLIEMIVVPILQYNSFSSSPTVGLGWSLVRDVVNMFVVLVLLVIAIATIVGYEKVSWQKNLPQFLMAVVLVNFSRTICGILIDLSQVVMFTFVNALLDVAAGNFANLTGMDVFGQYSNTAVRDASGNLSAIDAAEQLGAAYILFVLYACIFAVILLLALVYIWRIIMLWVLVILSPLTFFTWGLGGMFKFAAGSSADWWKKFTSALVIGPMLTFFLWLALSTATGDIVADEGFHAETTGAVSQTLVSFETSQLLGTFLGLVLLIVGMQQSAATANSMGGLAKKALGDEKLGQKLVGAVAKAPFQAAGRAAGYADRQAGRFLGENRFSDMAVKAGLQETSRAARNYLPEFAAGAVGRTVANVGGAAQSRIEHAQLAEKKAAKERVSKYSDDQLAEHVRLIAGGQSSPLSLNASDDIEAIKVKALTDGDFRKKLKKEVGDDNFTELMRGAINMKDGAIKAAGGDMDKVAKARSQSVHLMDAAERDKFIQSDKFDARSMSDEAAADMDVLKAMEKKYIRTDNNGRDIFAKDELLKGAYGDSLKKAAAGAGLTPPIFDAKTAAEKIGKGDSDVNALRSGTAYGSDALAASILSGRIKLGNLSVKDFDDANGDSLTKALLQTGTAPKRVGGSKDNEVRNEFLRRANALQADGKLDVTQTVQVDIANLDKGGADVRTLFSNVEEMEGGATIVTEPNTDRIERVLEIKPELVSQFASMVSGPGANPNVQDAISRSIKVEQVKRMTEQFKNSINTEDKKAIVANIDVITRALEGTASRGSLSKGEKNNYKIVAKSARIVGVRPPARVAGTEGAASDDDDDRRTT